jgi:4-amino-4-deoxychorismate lyase
MNYSLKALFGSQESIDLEEILSDEKTPEKGLYKCRILYDDRSKKIEFVPYEVRPVHTLRIIADDQVSYEFKYNDRKAINGLFELRKDCDDILIVKHGMVADSSIANIVFKRDDKWYTPGFPLLRGTMRSKLLELKLIQEEDIRLDEIHNFASFKLINAMLEFESDELDVSNIVF